MSDGLSVEAEPGFRPVPGWGLDGPLGGCVEVADVAVDGADNVYVFARKESTVFRLSPAGEVQARWDPTPFIRPHAITVSPVDAAVFCVDDFAQAVMKFTPDGEPVMRIESIADLSFTGYTRGDSGSVRRAGPPFCYPTAVSFGPDGDLFVSDGYGNARIHRFNAAGKLLDSWGEPGHEHGQFVLPHAVLVDGERLYVADRENDRVQVFDLDGRFLNEWTDCYRPAKLCRDAEGMFLLAELGRVNKAEGPSRELDLSAHTGRITRRDPSGRILEELTSTGRPGRETFFAPHGIALDSRGDLYIAETYVTFFRGQAPAHTPLHKLALGRTPRDPCATRPGTSGAAAR